MSLSLNLRNIDALANGGPVRMILDRRGAIIGRSPTVDWSLPDPDNYISSRHCEIRFEGGAYILSDTSTNGTLANGLPLNGSHRLANGDIITIGKYEIVVSLPEGFSDGVEVSDRTSNWGGWGSHATSGPVGVDSFDWGKPPARPPVAGHGPLSANATSSISGPAPTPIQSSDWDATSSVNTGRSERNSAPPGGGWSGNKMDPSSPWDSIGSKPQANNSASGWSSDASAPASPSASDIWGRLEQSNDIDWARGGFGVSPPVPPTRSRLGLEGSADELLPPMQPVQNLNPRDQERVPTDAPSEASQGAAGTVEQLSRAMGLPPDALHQPDSDTLNAAAILLRSLVAGLVVMLEARARAKAQLGAQTTSLEFDGNNPLKFARTPELALAQLLNPPERGFMNAQKAVQDAFVDLQSHQMATLKAMQGALKATLERFSPHAIGQRYQAKGMLAQILPGVHDAALWRAYVKEFSGVAQASDEAFMDVFAKEFRKSYEEETKKGKQY